MEIITIPVITAITYTIIEIIKYATDNAAVLKRFIPLIACALGVCCGLLAFFFVPGVMITNNVFIAIVLGGASGLAATGVYENIKNLFTKGKQKENGSSDNNISE
ncbi:MAG: hypothetical protein IKY67_06655 [Paludibacteraceae bacterium]|nr:hypothetical protein [Paludibacteraceae bacterium]